MVVVEAAESPLRVETVEEVKAEIKRVFKQRAEIALCIAKNESGYRANAIGYNKDIFHTHDRGIMQLNSYWHREITDAQAYDAKTNIQAAYRISKGGTAWGAWMTHTKCGV